MHRSRFATRPVMCAALDMASASVPRRGGRDGTRATCRDRERKCAASRPGPN